MKRIVFLCIALFFMSALVFAAGNRQSSAGAGKPEISVITLDRGEVAASEGTYEDNRWVRWINENSPVRVRIVPVPRTESVARMTALFAAGAAPDLIWEYGKGFMDGLYPHGVIQPVDEHIRNYSTAYKNYLASHPELMPYLMADDGRQYGMTSARNIGSILNHGLWIRQDWLDKFNMPTPTTTDQVVEFMRRVRDQDPDGNGARDTFGITFNYNATVILKTLFGQPFNGFIVRNGRFVDWTSTDGYRDFLSFWAMLYREGFIDPEYITDTNFSRQTELLVTGKSGIHLGSWSMETQWRELKTNVPSSNWQPFEPWTTSQGKFGLYTEPPANTMVCMNAASRNARDIMAYMDWMITDGWFPLIYGLEGRHYRLVSGIPQVINPDLNRIELNYAGEYPIVNQDQPIASWWPIQAAQDPLSQAYVPIQVRAAEIANRNVFNRYVPFTPSSDSINRFENETKDQIEAIETSIVLGRISVDEGLRQINEYKRRFGWDTINAEKDAWYQKNRSLF